MCFGYLWPLRWPIILIMRERKFILKKIISHKIRQSKRQKSHSQNLLETDESEMTKYFNENNRERSNFITSI